MANLFSVYSTNDESYWGGLRSYGSPSLNQVLTYWTVPDKNSVNPIGIVHYNYHNKK